MKKIVVLIIAFISISNFAQKGGLKGRVLDEGKQPLPGATIVITETKNGTSTNFNGFYEFLNITTGSYNVEVSFIGYGTITQKVKVTKGTTVKDFYLQPKTNELDEVIIQGSIAKGQAKALNKQKSNDNITNVISSDQVGKFPDSNIGDALKRVSGVAMQNDQGEARNIIIRGMAPELNSVTLNGDKLPSAEGDNRRVQMDLIPSDMIQTIEVSKAVTPDMEADAIGGSVNLVTRSAPSTFRASVTGSYGKTQVRDGSNYAVSGIVADRTKDGKFGVVFNGSYNANDYGSDNVEYEWKSPTEIKEHDIRKYDVKRIRKSVALNLDWKPDPNHTFTIKSMYNTRDDLENRFRLRYKYNGDDNEYKISRQTKGGIDNKDNQNKRLERQAVYKIGFGGEHLVLNNIKLDWKMSTSKAKEERPNERYLTYQAKIDGSKINQEQLNTRKPFFSSSNGEDNDASLFKLKEISSENKHTEEKKIGSRINIKIPLETEGDYQNSLKVGYKYKQKEKLRDNSYEEYDTDNFEAYKLLKDTPNSSQSNAKFLAGKQYQSGLFANNNFLGGLELTNGEEILEEFVPVNYNATEDIYAFYGMLKQKLGNKTSLIAGVRAEKTNVEYTGYSIDIETASSLADVIKKTGTQNYINWLPNLQLKHKPTKRMVLRAAWTNTIARPNYYDLVPYENINSDEEEASYGNSNLTATKAMNFDVMGEYYFANVGILSIGGFYKNISDFIYKKMKVEDDFLGGTDQYDVTRIYNGGEAKMYGFEASLQRKLNFLPSFFRNLTFYGNYTFTGSETKGVAGREDGLALNGAIKHMANTSLAYETKRFSLRGSLNFAGDYIDEYGESAYEDSYYDKQIFVDTNASYEVFKGFRVFVEGKNLTNQGLRYYQGVKNQTKQLEYYGMSWNAGLKYNF